MPLCKVIICAAIHANLKITYLFFVLLIQPNLEGELQQSLIAMYERRGPREEGICLKGHRTSYCWRVLCLELYRATLSDIPIL